MPSVVERFLAGEQLQADELATSLGWPEPNGVRRVAFEGCLLLSLGEEPALAIADHGEDPLAFAYHSGYEWVLDARPDIQRRIINTRWRKDNAVYQIPLSGIDDRELLSNLSPTGFEHNRLTAAARLRLPFDSQVATMESILIKKLGDLRRAAFRGSKAEPRDVDADVHLLVTQFFVLRAIEDLDLNERHGIPSLASTLVSGQVEPTKLESLYDIGRKKIQDKLFEDMPFRRLPLEATSSAILALYEQSSLPSSPELNFAWIDAHVFGRVYERYLSTVLAAAPPPDQLGLFSEDERELDEISQRRQYGVYYTPQPLVRILTQKVTDIVCPDGITVDNLPRIADFACGSGAFLAGALDKILTSVRREDRVAAARKIASDRLLIGVDLDSRAVALARLNIYLRLAQEREILPLPDIEDCVYVGNSL